ncbi:hypothetical protein D9M72_351200 [compost metagenome]
MPDAVAVRRNSCQFAVFAVPGRGTVVVSRSTALAIGVAVLCGRNMAGKVRGVRFIAFAEPQCNEHDQRGKEYEDAGPDVEPGGDTEQVDLFGIVDPHGFDPDPAQGVVHGVEPEQPPAAEVELPVQGQQDQHACDIPERLVEERRVEERIGRHASREVRVVGVDLQAPGKGGGTAEELLVEVVAPAPQRLGEQQPGSGGIEECGQLDACAAAADPCAHGAEQDGPPDPQTASLDLRNQGQITGAVKAGAEVGVRG